MSPDVDRDLETISLKCLEKDPSRRYATAQELAEEFGRWLEGRPIMAKPIRSVMRAWHWARDPAGGGAGRPQEPVTQSGPCRRTQWLALGLVLAVGLLLTARSLLPVPLPRQVRIATASESGLYHALGRALQPSLADRLHAPCNCAPRRALLKTETCC